MGPVTRKLIAGSALIFGLVSAVACGGGPTAPTTTATITQLPAVSEMVAEKTLGSSSAGNTIVIYSSFTCSHCADAHQSTFPQLKTKYIDTGKVLFTFRDFTRGTLDVRASMLARCAGNARYWDIVDALFRNQSSWAGDSSGQALDAFMRQQGMSQQVIDACVATSALSDAIARSRADGVQLGVPGTPTYFVNGNIVVGDQGLAAIEAYLKQ